MSPHFPDPVLGRFRSAVAAIYGDRLERVVLFGSRARGDHRADSDYDVAVFLRGYTTRWTELGPLAEVMTDILADTGAEIVALPFRAGAYRDDRPLMREIARDGLDL
jgi:predicted nucleotidyltransferase